MVINGKALIAACPIQPMAHEKHRAHGVSWGLSEAGYDIRIKQDVLFGVDPGQAVVAVNGVAKAGRFTIASSVERFNVPADMVGIIHDKSTWARQGLSVLNTVLEPGWGGWLTLELVYHGEGTLHIPAGSGIAQVIFHELYERAEYRGKYQNQPDRPVDAKFDRGSE